jgi:hypothetical protein
MQTRVAPPTDLRVDDAHREVQKRKTQEMNAWKRRAKIHVGIFSVSFVFTTGIFTLGILMWVRPDELLPLVLVALFSGVVFVATFTWLRMFILHKLLDEYPNKEEDPGVEHHLAKSIAYGFVALAFAIALGGIVFKIASASVF